mmetsp:Transcript_80239/g.134118  ORF Transcript_80239/g.134118 Transcript_80239/m.134118 type:complete len:375 (+) Transcript_80239:174-1298(+)
MVACTSCTRSLQTPPHWGGGGGGGSAGVCACTGRHGLHGGQLLLLQLDHLLDLLRIIVSQLLDIRLEAGSCILRQIKLVCSLQNVTPDIANLHLPLFSHFGHKLHHLLAAIAGQRRHVDADLLTVIVACQTEIRITADGLLNLLKGSLIEGGDHQGGGVWHVHACQLPQWRQRSVIRHAHAVQQRRTRPACPDGPELALSGLNGFVHLLFSFNLQFLSLHLCLLASSAQSECRVGGAHAACIRHRNLSTPITLGLKASGGRLEIPPKQESGHASHHRQQRHSHHVAASSGFRSHTHGHCIEQCFVGGGGLHCTELCVHWHWRTNTSDRYGACQRPRGSGNSGVLQKHGRVLGGATPQQECTAHHRQRNGPNSQH